ncbi:hypothetical protein LG943_07205 [Streptomonospora sp. S1-112]|uniref:Uncharacterized protein n=1 Tax=Streptomonospora mangrovi TaxID=2883123 RepID=A0A9X3NLP5_9ACTN|nr:hypothetical protein [Streptomonospora mangrovi]MDA0564114.1 hypothetical protein [Streptomonospora mangrovi]
MADGTDKAAHDARSLAVFAQAYLEAFTQVYTDAFARRDGKSPPFAELDTRAILTEAHRHWSGSRRSVAHGPEAGTETRLKKGLRTHDILVPADLAALAAEVAKRNPLAAAAVEAERLARYDPLSRDHLAERGRISRRIGSLLEEAGHLGGAALKYRAAQQFLTDAGLDTEAAEARTSGLRVLHGVVAGLKEVRSAVPAAQRDNPDAFDDLVGSRLRTTPGTGGWDTEMTAARTEIHAMTAQAHGPRHVETVEAARELVEHLKESGDHHTAWTFGKAALHRSEAAGPVEGERSIRRAGRRALVLYRSLVDTVLAQVNERISAEDARSDPRTRAARAALDALPHGLGAHVETALERARANADRASGEHVVSRAVADAVRDHRNRFESAHDALKNAVQRARISDTANPDEGGYLGGHRPITPPRGILKAVAKAGTTVAAGLSPGRRTPPPSLPGPRAARGA